MNDEKQLVVNSTNCESTSCDSSTSIILPSTWSGPFRHSPLRGFARQSLTLAGGSCRRSCLNVRSIYGTSTPPQAPQEAHDYLYMMSDGSQKGSRTCACSQCGGPPQIVLAVQQAFTTGSSAKLFCLVTLEHYWKYR